MHTSHVSGHPVCILVYNRLLAVVATVGEGAAGERQSGEVDRVHRFAGWCLDVEVGLKSGVLTTRNTIADQGQMLWLKVQNEVKRRRGKTTIQVRVDKAKVGTKKLELAAMGRNGEWGTWKTQRNRWRLPWPIQGRFGDGRCTDRQLTGA